MSNSNTEKLQNGITCPKCLKSHCFLNGSVDQDIVVDLYLAAPMCCDDCGYEFTSSFRLTYESTTFWD